MQRNKLTDHAEMTSLVVVCMTRYLYDNRFIHKGIEINIIII